MTLRTQYGRTGPTPDEDSRAFWESLDRHVIRLQQCRACGEVRFPPMPACPGCGSTEWASIVASGRGSVYSWILVHRPIGTITQDEVPCTIATVELEEGCRIVGKLGRGETPSIGQPVVARFDDHDGWCELAFTVAAGDRDNA
jgi:uncharacterized OB-fold protein